MVHPAINAERLSILPDTYILSNWKVPNFPPCAELLGLGFPLVRMSKGSATTRKIVYRSRAELERMLLLPTTTRGFQQSQGSPGHVVPREARNMGAAFVSAKKQSFDQE